jgi:hypothetical protein
MKISVFKTVKSQQCELLTAPLFDSLTHDPHLLALCDRIAQETDHERQQELKKRLPIVTWHASFSGARRNDQAIPSGLFMLDVDGVENPYQLWCSIIGRREELGILLAHKTPSQHGLRLVCRCRPEFTTIDQCQQWLSAQIGIEHDPACKDWARSSYLVPASYIYYMDGRLFTDDPEVVYEVKSVVVEPVEPLEPTQPSNHQTTYRGIPLKDIARQWLLMNGGEPAQGERNTRLHALAYELRYITDFNEATLLAVMPSYGLGADEMRALVHSACSAPRSKNLPKTLEQVLRKLSAPATEEEEDEDITLHSPLSTLHCGGVPVLPPLIRQLASKAPADFLVADVLCQLPLLGALGSKLRARYLDGRMHSPSFQVSLEAPQASGKSFMVRLAEQLLQPIVERDQVERQKEQEYNERLNELKVTGVKVTAKNREEMLGQRPKGVIRYVPATISITKMLMRMENARGLHLVAVCEEIDTVTKAFKRGFSSYSDALRVSFDNGPYGQDYASENSYSGILPLYYNTLFSGTPRAMRRFYPDVEDGLVSRVCFVTLPDQFGKPMPVWGELSERERREVENQIGRLDAVSIVGDVVQPDHVMELDFLNRSLEQWLHEQQQEAVRTGDRTRDIFCRRAAVVGFRAGMLAWFLYGEKDTRTYRNHTIAFACWVADQMLTQHLLRFQIEGTGSNINRWEEAYRLLGDEFGREELQKALTATGSDTRLRQVIYRWQLLGCIEVIEEGRAANGSRQSVRFRKKR